MSGLRAPREPVEHAVCLTGLERSFSEVGNNVREGLLHLLGSPRFIIFGVRPIADPWHQIRRLLPVDHIELQRPSCWSGADVNLTRAWMHCDMKSRGSDCLLGFLQMLCDLAHCERMIQAHEASEGWKFRAVVRLRPDCFWETRVKMPTVLQHGTVYVPEQDSQGGINDHLAFGDRASMALYLRRARLVGQADRLWTSFQSATGSTRALKGSNSETFLQLALHAEGLSVVRLRDWAYCLHTRAQLRARFGMRGCIGRVRCRTRCVSLVCGLAGTKSGDCSCHNVTCATIEASTSTGPHIPYIPTDAKTGKLKYHTFSTVARRKVSGACIDVGITGSQLMHACLKADPHEQRCGTVQPCAWPRDTNNASLAFSDSAQLPDCMFTDRQPPVRDAASRGACYVTKRTHFAEDGGVWLGGDPRDDGTY